MAMTFHRGSALLSWMNLLVVCAAASGAATASAAVNGLAFATLSSRGGRRRSAATSRVVIIGPGMLPTSQAGSPSSPFGFAGTAWALNAKQRRRRQRADDSADDEDGGEAEGEYDPSDDTSSSFSPGNADDLPDFVLSDDEATSSSQPSTSSTFAASNAPQVAAGTMGSRPKPAAAAAAATPVEVKSIRDLLGDRSLERKMVFDDSAGAKTSDEELPDLVQLATSTKSSKRQEQAARKAALQQAASSSSNEEQDILKQVISKLPIEVTNDKGEVTPQKLLEAGTWLGIFLLVAWEFYINSPLFDRAAPMAPVVY